MKITETRGHYFYFSLEDEDFKKDYPACKRFINRFTKEFTGGKDGDRYWLGKMKCWAIKNDCRQRFNDLLNEYFDITKQESLL